MQNPLNKFSLTLKTLVGEYYNCYWLFFQAYFFKIIFCQAYHKGCYLHAIPFFMLMIFDKQRCNSDSKQKNETKKSKQTITKQKQKQLWLLVATWKTRRAFVYPNLNDNDFKFRLFYFYKQTKKTFIICHAGL